MLIKEATDPVEIDAARELIREYEQELAEDLCFQSFESEMAGLPGKYGPPKGSLLLAWHDGEPIGCVALRPIDERTCEMKRLYVRPAARGLSCGRLLAQAIVEAARDKGYERMVLDTLGRLKPALELYNQMGFYEIEPYYDNPIPDAVYLAIDLQGRS